MSKIGDFIYRHKYIIIGLLIYTGIIGFIYYYFLTLLIDNQNTYENDIITLFETSFIFSIESITASVDRYTENTNAIFKITHSNITQSQFQSLTNTHLDPFREVYSTYRYSNLVYQDEISDANMLGKRLISPLYHIQNNSIYDFYVPIEYSAPDVFSDNDVVVFGFDLYSFEPLHIEFFNKFLKIDSKVIATQIPFEVSIDDYDLGMYFGKVNYIEEYCNVTEANSFIELVHQNAADRRCFQGFSYLAGLTRTYIENTLILTGDFIELKSSQLPFVVIDNNIDNEIKVISRSTDLFDNNINELNNIDKFKDTYHKHTRIDNVIRFADNSIHDDISIYLFFTEDDVQNKEINNQILIIYIVIPVLYALTLITAIIVYYSYNQHLNISNEKYSELRKIMTYVNHELRNPLNMIFGTAQVIQEMIIETMCIINGTDISGFTGLINNNYTYENLQLTYETLKSVHSNVKTIQNSARITGIIVGDILDLQKLEDNRIVVNESYFNSVELINDFYKTIMHKDLEISHIVTTEIYVEENIVFYTDRDRLIQIMVNIYQNSAKHTFDGKICVSVKLDKKKQNVIITMSDTGEGIPEDIKADILKKTFINRKAAINSVGIGLYIVGLLAKILNYNITFESEKDKGTTFYILLKNHERKYDLTKKESLYDQVKSKVTIVSNDDNINEIENEIDV